VLTGRQGSSKDTERTASSGEREYVKGTSVGKRERTSSKRIESIWTGKSTKSCGTAVGVSRGVNGTTFPPYREIRTGREEKRLRKSGK